MGWIKGLDADESRGMSRRGDRIHTGGNSGYAAVNLAAIWGAARIVLLGFDMQLTGGARHAHADHPPFLGNPPTPSFPVWRQRFAEAAQDLREMGVEVVNATRETALTVFERVPLEKAIDRPPVVLAGMLGFGDNIYQRPFIRELARGHEVYLRTPWPQLYADLEHVHLARSDTTLRTQHRSETSPEFQAMFEKTARELHCLGRARPELTVRQISYVREMSTGRGSIWTAFSRTSCFGCEPIRPMDLPPLPPLPDVLRGIKAPICMVRPVTVRAEWTNTARNPLPEYVADVATWLREEGYHVVSVADLEDGEEEALDPLPPADTTLHAGELSPLQLLAVVAGSAAVVGPVGWIVPAAIAAHVPAFFVLGGQGGHNAPERITDPSMSLDLIGWGVPDAFCRCSSLRHSCAKGNTRLREQFDEWRLRLVGGRPPAMAA